MDIKNIEFANQLVATYMKLEYAGKHPELICTKGRVSIDKCDLDIQNMNVPGICLFDEFEMDLIKLIEKYQFKILEKIESL